VLQTLEMRFVLVLSFVSACATAPAHGAWSDFFGDGSLWVIAAPGHTPGSLAFLANTSRGPVLFAGDTGHTRWGWEHQVEPCTFTGDHAQNRASLAQLASIAKAVPGLVVQTGHEFDPAAAAALSSP